MPSIVKLYGPPGTGKTTRLTAQALKSMEMYGPDRVCGITFTRAAADELKLRIAAGLGLRPPLDQRARKRYLDHSLPWVGTIHSLALKMAGGKVLGAADIREFAAARGGSADGLLSEDVDSYTWAEPGSDEVGAALAIWSAARHRMIGVADAWGLVPWGMQGPSVSVPRAERIIEQYEDYKRQIGKIDFEDMLVRGKHEMPPVDVVLADEVQDNSPLLWSVLDTWSTGRFTALAGDPYQAIYLFMGAEPDLFIQHAGAFTSLGDSRRLTDSAAQRAQRVLRAAGYSDARWLDTWSGVGSGSETDGSEFFLARTGRLLQTITQDLEGRGVPYGWTRGGGPLETKAADSFRTLLHLKTRGAAPAHAVWSLAESCGPRVLPHGEKARLKRAADAEPDALVSADELERAWGTLNARALGLRYGEYLQRVYGQHGIGAFLTPPRVRVGTIHSAKGKEADTVHLVDSWGTLPYRNTQEPRGRRAEGCVAYVALTRHRHKLQFIRAGFRDGMPYPDF
jgi:DNA helicase-2/ATP-dependent DNA helicase PcrA